MFAHTLFPSLAGIKLDITAHSHFLLRDLRGPEDNKEVFSKISQVINIYVQPEKGKEEEEEARQPTKLKAS